jgi:hypothetical protein
MRSGEKVFCFGLRRRSESGLAFIHYRVLVRKKKKLQIPHPLKRGSAPIHTIGVQKTQMTAKSSG